MGTDDQANQLLEEFQSLLTQHGHQRLKKLVYKLQPQSQHFDHLISIFRDREQFTRRSLFTVDFGIKSLKDDTFALNLIKKYGILSLRLTDFDQNTNCFIRCSYFLICNSYKKYFDPQLGVDHEKKIFEDMVLNKCSKEFLRIDGLNEYYSYLISNKKDVWYSWTYSNPAARCAIIASMGWRLGFSEDRIRNDIAPYLRRVDGSRNLEIDSATYVDYVFAELKSRA